MPMMEAPVNNDPISKKKLGAFYSPPMIVTTLLNWAIRSPIDRLLDPSCGDGRFISQHAYGVGVEMDAMAANEATLRAPGALVHHGDFFTWARLTEERFDCAAGNPPFIRYQSFSGKIRCNALSYCQSYGAKFTGLTSSWAPFLVTAATLLKPGGRMAFVVPAEIGHAPYATPLLEFLISKFDIVHIVAIRDKIFPNLSEDCWLLYAEGFTGHTDNIRFTSMEHFVPMKTPPVQWEQVSAETWRSKANCRLRHWLIPKSTRELYWSAYNSPQFTRLGELARIGIGYVSGANEFFHFQPSVANKLGISHAFLHPTVRTGKLLPRKTLTTETVKDWMRRDEPFLLLHLKNRSLDTLPTQVRDYLDSGAGLDAREGYKCRNRDPWFIVPDVRVPSYFLTYMSGKAPLLVKNDAGCSCTNALHAVEPFSLACEETLLRGWDSPITRLSSELQGHPLGGGLLKLEPREAAAIICPTGSILSAFTDSTIEDAIWTLKRWRHNDDSTGQQVPVG
jgi:adenine-specific DNA methylase